MEFSLAYLKSPQQITVRNFTQGQDNSVDKVVDLEELDQLNLAAVYTEVGQEMNGHDLLIKEFSGNEEQFNSLDFESAKSLLMRDQASWLLQNNLNLLQKLIPYTDHLKALWANDRQAFMEELWHILKNNLGTRSLKIVFNSIKKAQNENEKDQLIKAMTEGERKPQTTDQNTLGEALMKQYDYQLEGHFELAKHDQENGQIIFLATINKSPLILMAELYQFNPLQRALLTALFDGLQTQR